jgi:hypothetical protein
LLVLAWFFVIFVKLEFASREFPCQGEPLEVDLHDWYRRNGSKKPIPRVQNLWYCPENRDELKTPRHYKFHPIRYHDHNLHYYCPTG